MRAERLRRRFHETFWVSDEAGLYPAVALDAEKRPVDSLTSNIGHLLGTGLLDPDQVRLVAARVVSPELCSGYGLRTLSTTASGYWPLSYHGGSVWTHDTAIVIDGLAREGYAAEAKTLARGLLSAAVGFGGGSLSCMPVIRPHPTGHPSRTQPPVDLKHGRPLQQSRYWASWADDDDPRQQVADGDREVVQAIQIKPAVWVTARLYRAWTSAQLTTFHQAFA